MAKTAKKRFAFDRKPIQLGSSGNQVRALQAMLAGFGYLRGAYEPGKVCRRTERAIRRYQRFNKLKIDGVAGPKTQAFIEQPRCGVPDIPVVPYGASAAPFVLRGCKYEKKQLTFAFLNGTSDLSGQREREIVREAFGVWAGVANVTFEEVSSSESPDFRIAWHSGSHGDSFPFDGPSNTLAHGFFPPPCGGANAGDLHFDDAELWTDNPAAPGILLRQVAIHEIGHLLGLSHSDDTAAIMFPTYSADRTNLAQDDIDGIQQLYGAPSALEQLVPAATTNGTLARGGEERHYQFVVPQNLAISIDGPEDADFDLYVRKNAQPTVDEWDFRAYTVSADETILLPTVPGEKYFIMVRSFEGAGDYKLKVEPSGA